MGDGKQLVVLNYHTIGTEKSDHYTVSSGRFREHLEIVLGKSWKSVSFDSLNQSGGDEARMAMWNFDDGTKDHYEVVSPILNEHGIKGVFYISTGKVGGEKYVTGSQIAEMAKAGHEMECHGHRHQRMDVMSPAELRDELARSLDHLEEWSGRRPVTLAPPGGFLNGMVLEEARRAGLCFVRTMRWGLNAYPPNFEIRCQVVTGRTSLRQYEDRLAGKGVWKQECLYHGKQALRSVLPAKFYLGLRKLVSGSK
ncbi:polysaccharide deacetylase family protein [bacterium]|nr:polysaccharide deacetylase family protein [bacterium]